MVLQVLLSFKLLFSYYREGNDPDDSSSITYSELLEQVCKFANVLKSLGKYDIIFEF